MSAPAAQVLTLVAGMIREGELISEASDSAGSGPEGEAELVSLDDARKRADAIRMAGGDFG